MKSNRIRRTVLPLGLAGGVAAALFAGLALSPVAVVAKPAPDKVAAQVRKKLGAGDTAKAIALAEELVAANPREGTYRALLGQGYLRAGRFESAAQALNEAMQLGDSSARTALSLALAYAGTDRPRDAVAILDDWRDAIPAADLGLAYALAGEAARGVTILHGALRGGENTPKLRQNLAYAFALDGRWREARVMAAQDVPADQLDARISGWADRSRPDDGRQRIATLIGAPLRSDRGMPAQMALSASVDQQQLAAETGVQRLPATAAASELPPADPAALAEYQPVSLPAAGGPAPASSAAPLRFAASPVVQPVPASLPGEAPRAERAPAPAAFAAHRPGLRPRRAAAPVAGKGSSHAVQLGSFSSEQGARRAWGYYTARNPELRNFRMTITPAKVRGKSFWRVAATGLDGRGAGGLCSKVKARGGVCFAYATTGVRGAAPAYAAVGGRAPQVAMALPLGARRK